MRPHSAAIVRTSQLSCIETSGSGDRTALWMRVMIAFPADVFPCAHAHADGLLSLTSRAIGPPRHSTNAKKRICPRLPSPFGLLAFPLQRNSTCFVSGKLESNAVRALEDRKSVV